MIKVRCHVFCKSRVLLEYIVFKLRCHAFCKSKVLLKYVVFMVTYD